MRSVVRRLLTGRSLAAAVLSVFIVLGPIAAWMRAAMEEVPATASAVMKANPASSPGAPRVGKYAWPRKALMPKAPADLHNTAPCKRIDDGQKLWTFIAAPPPPPGTRLDLCPEFTKPASLCPLSMGTPRQHRAPPAALL